LALARSIEHPSYPTDIDGPLAFTVRELGPPSPSRPRLLDRVREAIRARHYSRRTEKAYVAWTRRYILKLVSLCGTSLSTRNRESAIVASIATRTPWALAAAL
jgi:hypothetical protein